jgi:SPP1 family predicted phage head-tail adaptor
MQDPNKPSSTYPTFGNISAGSLDEIMTIQRRNTGVTAGMDQPNTWTNLHTNVWCERNPRGGREFMAADQVVGMEATLWRIRYIAGIQQGDRVLVDTEVHEIVYTMQLGRKEGLLILTEKYDSKQD